MALAKTTQEPCAALLSTSFRVCVGCITLQMRACVVNGNSVLELSTVGWYKFAPIRILQNQHYRAKRQSSNRPTIRSSWRCTAVSSREESLSATHNLFSLHRQIYRVYNFFWRVQIQVQYDGVLYTSVSTLLTSHTFTPILK